MAFVKKAVDGVTAPAKNLAKGIKANPLTIVGVLAILLLAFRFRSQIMAGLNKIPFIGQGANKLSGEG